MTDGLPNAYGAPPLCGLLRATPEDFFVDEVLGFVPDGHGEHVLLRVEKRGANTEWVARALARFAGVPTAAVSYAGLKDRRAVARQWFSVHLVHGREPNWSDFAAAEFRVLQWARHGRKLRRGAHAGNRFRICLRQLCGDWRAAQERIAQLVAGVPNYFGEQRFGRARSNLARAEASFAPGARRSHNRHERGLLFSAARAALFNAVLAERVRRGEWNRPLDGDVFMLQGSHSIFGPEPITAELVARCAQGDIAPTGPLWGAGPLRTNSVVAALEQAVAEAHRPLALGLARSGLEQERRTLVLVPRELCVEQKGRSDLCLSFYLSSGGYATVLLREIACTSEPEPGS
jgi:tRNA pseudouridine13 synthase